MNGSDGGSDSGQDVSEPSAASVTGATSMSTTGAKTLRRTSRSTSISSVRTAFFASTSPPVKESVSQVLTPEPTSAISVPAARHVDTEFYEQGGKWVHVVQRKPNTPQVVSVPGHAHANGAQVQLAIQRVELPLSRDRRPAVPGAEPGKTPARIPRSPSETSNMSRVSSTSTLGSSYSDENGQDRNAGEMSRQVAELNGLLSSHVPRPGVSGIPTLRPPHAARANSALSLKINASDAARLVPLARSSSLNTSTQQGLAAENPALNENGHVIESPPPASFLSGSYIEVDSSASPTMISNRPSTPPAAPLTPSRIPLPTSSPSSFTRIVRPPTYTTTAVREPAAEQQREKADQPQLKRIPSDNLITVQEDERNYWTERWEMVLSKVPNEAREFLGAKFIPFQESTLNVFNRYDSGSDARGFGAESYWSSMVKEKATGNIHVAHVYEDPGKAYAVQKWSALVSKYFLSSSSTPSSPTLYQHPSSPTLPSHELRGRSFSMRASSTSSKAVPPQRARSPVSATSSTTSVSLSSALVHNQVEILPLASGQGCVRITPLYLVGPMHLMYHADEHAHDNSPDMLARIVLKTLAPLLKVMDHLYKLRDAYVHQSSASLSSSRTSLSSSAPTSLFEEALCTDWTVGHILHPVAVHYASPITREMSFRYMVLDMVPTSVAADKHRSSCALLADFLCQTLNEKAVKVDEWLQMDRPEAKPDSRRIRHVLARLATVQDAHEFRDVRKLVSRLYKSVSKEQQREAARGPVDGQMHALSARSMTAPPSTWSSAATLVD
ncbi:hypothetical protein BCR44DRAFT_1033205 [Catenaria anguillulae PL171]|uniref:Uncharacterized protein n=1 Tax=Catenaria anguillulae PL171 TaxID=765915 RepID=A0A1Y2HTZ1_9FUNG|nr:hypothetical protein BCR44DRAFT_1033205 [Catenaria anguillulae PL171]